jgi:hypothetical protein
VDSNINDDDPKTIFVDDDVSLGEEPPRITDVMVNNS